MNLTYQEKSAWGSLVITAWAFAYYFYSVVQQWLSIGLDAGGGSLLLKVLIVLVAAEAAYHIAIALLSGDDYDASDERDELIKAKSNSWAGWFMSVGVVMTIGYVLTRDAVGMSVSAMFAAHVLMFFFVLSELARFALQIFFYHRGVK